MTLVIFNMSRYFLFRLGLNYNTITLSIRRGLLHAGYTLCFGCGEFDLCNIAYMSRHLLHSWNDVSILKQSEKGPLGSCETYLEIP